ncbi:60S ribosomal protein L18a-like isoform X1 [Leptotrombidium deliense]|uniref:60S ribosomal protein L18a n=1 Tax=Leptotrombidium deliense TaxID=299467 RepID=A0A443SL66_9ACAR|nr:60S ribosomal protein L18a-like isoform X1 [Leptotrombidium deliense]
MKASGKLRQYKIIGRKYPTEKEPDPQLYRMTIFAPDHVVAKSRFWYFLKRLKKVKKTVGEIVQIKQVAEKNPNAKVKNYGVWLRYNSRTGTHNMYREYRDMSTSDAVTQCYRDMGARHRARADTIQIIRVEAIEASKCRRPHVRQFHDSKIKFPLPFRFDRKYRAPKMTTRKPKARML